MGTKLHGSLGCYVCQKCLGMFVHICRCVANKVVHNGEGPR